MQISDYLQKLEIKYVNNAQIVIHEADFEVQDALHNAIMVSLKHAKTLAEVLLTITSDTKVNECLWECLARCTYNGAKITKQTFSDPNAKANYYPIKLACLRDNILPFLPALILTLQNLGLTTK